MFFKSKPRLMGGVFGIFAPPSEGKTYVLTDIALDMMKRGRRVFSNYPIRSVDGKYCSRFLDKDMLLKENFNDAVLIITEIHRWFNSREFKDFSNEHHHFFSTSGQSQRSIYYDDQSISRVDIVIREDTNLFYEIEKVTIPLVNLMGKEIPLYFKCFIYNDLENMKMAHFGHEGLQVAYDRLWFNINVASAYDTRYFGHDNRDPFEGITWEQYYKQRGIDIESPQRTKLGEVVKKCQDKVNLHVLLVKKTIKLSILPWFRKFVLYLNWRCLPYTVNVEIRLNVMVMILVKGLKGIWKKIWNYLNFGIVKR